MTQGQDLPPGATFADFTIEGVLGRGGMGVVYRARQERLSRLVALKVIAPHLTHDAGFRERFRREAAMAAAIDHPSILPIYEAGEFNEQPFIVMRHVDGTDLKTLIERKGRLDPRRAVEITSDIAGALDAAHRRGLVHRDVKPANILIGEEGDSGDDEVVYLTDFGLTKGRSDERLTQTGKWVGTVDYMAPEQIEGKDIDGRSDEYALACVLYEALTGTVPFQRESDVQIMWAHIRDEPPRPSQVRQELGPAMDAVIARGMAKDPNDRFATCREFARAAQEALGGTVPAPPPGSGGGTVVGGTVVGGTVVGGTLTGDTPPAPPVTSGAPVGSGGGPPPAPAARPGRGGGNRTPILIGAAVLGVVVIGAIAAFALSGGDGDGGDPVTVNVTTNVTVAADDTGSEPGSDTAGPVETSGDSTAAPETTVGGDTGPAADTSTLEATTAPDATTAPADTFVPPEDSGATGATSEPVDTGAAPGAFPPATAQEVVDLAKQPVSFVALYDLIQGGNAGTLRLAYDGDTRIAYRVELADQGTIWAGFADGAIQFGCLQAQGAEEPTCTDGTDREPEYRSLIQEFVNGLLSADAVETNFGAIAAAGTPVLPGEMTDEPVACIQSVGATTQRLCVRADSVITEVTVIEEGKEIGARARQASTSPTEDDFSAPAPIT